MNPEQFTEKTAEYLSAALRLAKEHSHIELRPPHLAVAFFEDNEGLANQGQWWMISDVSVIQLA